MRKVYSLFVLIAGLTGMGHAQVTGTVNIPDEATLTSTITSLNTSGVGAGGATLNFTASFNLTSVKRIGSATLNGTLSAANPLVLSGNNNTLNAQYAGTNTGSLTTGANDAMFVFEGTDYITVQNLGFTEQASNTTTTTAIENALAFYNRLATAPFDGCQHITISGCTFGLGKAATVGAAIYSTSYTYTGTTNLAWAAFATDPTQMNRVITINNNTFNGSYNHIVYRGSSTGANGRQLVVTNNTFNNIGGGSSTSYGTYALYLDSLIFNNNTGATSTAQTTTNYIAFASTNCGGIQEANNNNITLQSGVTISATNGITYTSIGANRTMNGNTIVIGSFPNITSGVINGLTATYSGGNNNLVHQMNGNFFQNQNLPGTTGTISIFNHTSSTGGTGRYTHTSNNTITNITKTNNGIFRPVDVGTADTAYAENNTVTNIDITNNSASSATTLQAIYASTSARGLIIRNNTINNLNVSGSTTNASGVLNGIFSAALSTGNVEISGNTINNLNFDNTSTGSASVIAITQGAAGTAGIFKNKIYDINANSGAASLARGIQTTAGTTVNVYNNLVGNLTAANSASVDAIRGINIASSTATSSQNVSYNSIYLNASSSGANFGTAGIFHTYSATATTAALTMRNNVVVNTSIPAGTGVSAAFRRSAATDLNNYNTTSNNNLFYAGTPSATNLIYTDGTNNDQTLAAFKTRVAPRESASVTENPNFLSTTGSDADFLHINTATATQIESGGIAVAGITDDYDGDARNATTPDIGADEFAGTGVDLSPPNITYTPLTFTCLTGNRTLTASITDASGVPTSGAGLPVLYWRINAGSWNAATGTFVSGSNYDFVFGSGAVAGDVVQYYIVAQDNAGTPNVGASPSTGASGYTASPPAAATPPSTPASYSISGSLNGTYTVGAGGAYTTLTAAINAYNSSCLSGAVVFELTDASYGPSETFPIVIANNPDASATNTLTIRPAAGNAVTISGTSGAVVSALIRLNGARYISFDGLNTGGASLLVENTSATTGTAVFWLSSNGAGQGANNNTIKNTSIRAGIAQNASANVTYGIVIAGGTLSATIASITAGDDNDNTTIQGNTFTRLRYGVYTRGGSATNPNTGTVITGNTFGPAAFGAEQIGKAGVVTREEDGIQITQNTFRYIGGDFANTSAGTDRVAIALTTDGAWTNSTTPPTAVMVRNAVITRNNISNVVDERTFSAVGIVLSTADGANPTNNLVANNMIANLKGNGTSTDQTAGIGIGTGNTDKIVFNSIYLSGDTDPNASATTPTQTNTGINITSTSVVNPLVRNNIVVMDLTSSSAPTLRGACIGVPASYAWGTGNSNYNNFYAPPGNTVAHTGVVGGTSGTFHLSLANWQTAVSQDANSSAVSPVFISATDLHLVTGSNGGLNNTGTPVAGVTNDFDNDTRNATTPDMGADEFSPPLVTDLAAISLQAPVVKNCYTNAETVTMRIQNNSGGTHDFATNPATLTINITGAATTTLNATVNTGTLASGATLDVNMGTLNMGTPGTYTFNGYIATTGDAILNNDTLAAVNRTVVALAAGTVSSNPGSYCVTPGTPVLTMSGGTGIGNIQWQESTVSGTGPWTDVGTNSTTYTPGGPISGTTYYRAAVSCNGNTAFTNVDTVELNNPQLLSTTPGSRCGTGTVTLSGTASAGSTIYWYAAATGGTALGTGSSFTTPVINNTTTYYAAAGVGSSSETAAKPVYTSTTNTAGNAWGLVFNVVNQPITLQSVKIYSVGAAAGVMSVQLTDNTGAVLATAGPFNYPAGSTGSPVPVTLPLNFNIPVGTGYRLLSASMSGGAVIRETSGNTFPYNSASGNVSVTSGYITGTSTTYYWFYDWQVITGCETARTAVTATVTPPPPITTVADATICNNEGKMLNVTSTLGDFDTYTWSPQTGLFTDNTYSTPYTGQNLSTVYVKTTAGGTTNYVVTGTQTGGSQCSNTDTVAITVMPATVIAAAPANICVSGSAVLTVSPSAGYGTGSIQWQTSATGGAGTYTDISGQTGTSYTTPVINTTTWYGVVLKDGAGNTCQLNPTYQLTVNNPSLTGTTPGTRCGTGSVTLGATAAGSGTVRWYNAATGGTVLGTGTSFNTPAISTTTTYYAAAAEGISSQNLGAASINSLPNSGTNSSFTAGMLFDVTGGSVKINSVDIYPTTAVGTRFQIVVRSGGGSGTVIATYQDTTTVSGTVAAPVVQTVPVNFTIPAGTGYAITFFNGTLQPPLSGTAVYPGALRNNPSTGATFPYTIPGVISITNGTLANVWYYFYNWQVETACESARTAVTATVNHAPLSVISPAVSFITCDSVKLAVPGAGDIKITEVTLQRNGTGQTAAYPAFATGEDLVEISNISASPVDVSGYTFGDYADNSATAVHAYTIPAATVIPANGVLILHLGAGTDDAPNLYFNTGGTANSWVANSQVGLVLKNASGNVVDVVGCGGSTSGSYTFAAGTGVTAADWSGFAPNVTGFAGVSRLVSMDNNTGSDWLQSNTPAPLQTMGVYNSGLAYPAYTWSPSTGLYTNAALTIPYTGQNVATVYAKPGTTTTYTIQGSSNGCTANGTAVVNVLAPGTLEWTGAVNTDWTNAGNWKCGIIPTTTSNVHISSGKANYPVITLNVEIRSLTITAGATVTVGAGFDLKLNGN